MGAPEIGRARPRRSDERGKRGRTSCMHPTGAYRPGGSPLRAAGGQPYWNARPDQTRPLQSLQKTNSSPLGLGFGIWNGVGADRSRASRATNLGGRSTPSSKKLNLRTLEQLPMLQPAA